MRSDLGQYTKMPVPSFGAVSIGCHSLISAPLQTCPAPIRVDRGMSICAGRKCRALASCPGRIPNVADSRMAGDTEYRKVHDGWRPASLNAITTTANPVSQHIHGRAIDITDPNNTLYQWIGDCVLEECKLWLEALRGPWVHVQTVPPNGWKKGMSRTFRI